MISTNLFGHADNAEKYEAGQAIFQEGDPGKCLYVVSAGEVELWVHGHLVETLGQGGIFGEMALIEQKPRSARAVAKTSCQIVPVDQKRFEFLVQQTPFFSLHLMKIMADRLRRTDDRLL